MLTDGLCNIKPGRMGVVCPVSDILKLVGEEEVVKIWCIKSARFLECSYFVPGPFFFPVKLIDC